MKTLVTQSWEIKQGDEKVSVTFDKLENTVSMMISIDDKHVTLYDEEIKELKNILESTKYIFSQEKE